MNNRNKNNSIFHVPFLLTVNLVALVVAPKFGIAASCSWEVVAAHEVIYNMEKAKPEYLSKPSIAGNCEIEVKWHYQDQYQEIGCNVAGFNRYFQPSNWMARKINGDGGVDVTGAPNLKLVEGANNALVIAASEAATQVKLVIPADGYVAFDWRSFGGSNLFSITEANSNTTYSTDQGSFFSSLMHTGDTLTLQLGASMTTINQAELANFKFYSNALGVITRNWTATDIDGATSSFTQLITVEKTTLTNVILPKDFDGAAYSVAPVHTGYPVIDEDGDPITIGDQFPLLGRNDGFEVSWSDNWVESAGNKILQRTWIIKDKCSGSELEDTQIIKLTNLKELQEAKKLNPTGFSEDEFSFRTKSGCGHYYELFSSSYGNSDLPSPVAPLRSNLTDNATNQPITVAASFDQPTEGEAFLNDIQD